MNLHLAEISTQVTPGAHAVVTLDGAGWHQQGDKLKLPDNISLLPLPPYSPELNPQENIWQFLPAELPGEPRVRHLHRPGRCLLRGLERAHRHARADHIHRHKRVGESGQRVGPLV
jgi:DDE superfamily endonuclease